VARIRPGQAELLLDVVGVLVGDHVREPEVALRLPVARPLTGEVPAGPAQDIGRERLADEDRVVRRAVEGGVLVGDGAAA